MRLDRLADLATCIAITPAESELIAPLLRQGIEEARRRDRWNPPNQILALLSELEEIAAASKASRDEVVTEVVATTVRGLSTGMLENMNEVGVTRAAEMSNCTRQAINRKIARGTLPARRDERNHWRIAVENLEGAK